VAVADEAREFRSSGLVHRAGRGLRPRPRVRGRVIVSASFLGRPGLVVAQGAAAERSRVHRGRAGGDFPAYSANQFPQLIDRWRPDSLWNDVHLVQTRAGLFAGGFFADYDNKIPREW